MVVSRDADIVTLRNPLFYPLSLILSMYFLAPRQGVVIHSAGLDVGGRGLVIGGESGAGKSTLSRSVMGENISILSDDRVIVRRSADAIMTFGTPWLGEARFSENVSVPLGALAFLSRGECNNAVRLDQKGGLERLLKVVSVPWYDVEVFSDILDWCGHLVESVPVFELSFVPETDVGGMLAELMQD